MVPTASSLEHVVSSERAQEVGGVGQEYAASAVAGVGNVIVTMMVSFTASIRCGCGSSARFTSSYLRDPRTLLGRRYPVSRGGLSFCSKFLGFMVGSRAP